MDPMPPTRRSRRRDPPPDRLGPCRIRRPLGSGGWATVYLAELTEDRPYAAAGELVAVKVLRGDRAAEPVNLERFRREAEIGLKVRHPRVVATRETGEDTVDGRRVAYLVLEYVEGRTLRTVIDQYGMVPEALLRGLAAQIAGALAAVHDIGAVHRDLKPTNILITPDYQVKLMDLGVALDRAQDGQLTQTGHFIGTLDYVAPEQMLGLAVTPAADLYGLGVVLFEAATGSLPFTAGDVQQAIGRRLLGSPAKVGTLNPQLTLFVEEVIACLLEKEPVNRFASSAELARVLEEGEASRWWIGRETALRGASPSRELRRVRARRDTSFVGRDAELDRLAGRFAEAAGGRGGTVVVEGEAGIGKSRLIEELLQRLAEEGREPLVLFSTHAPGGAHGPGPLAEALARHFGDAGLAEELARLLPGVQRLAPALAALLQGLPPPAGAEPLPHEMVPPLLARLARAMARERPLVWVVEDLHFATAEARSRVEALVEAARDAALLVVATTRPAADGGAVAEGALGDAERLTLERLSRPQVFAVLREALGIRPEGHPLARQIAEKSDGNPFFVNEIVREVKERQARQPATEQWRAGAATGAGLAGEAQLTTVPSSVRALLGARVRDLDEEDRALLNVAAVEGFAFDPELVARVRDRRPLGVLERLAELERRLGVVRATGAGFEFDHHLLQEVIYETLPPALRRAYHTALAEAAAERAGLGPGEAAAGELAELVASHFLHGGRRAGWQIHLVPALDHLAWRHDNERLLELAGLALEALGEGEPALRAEIELRRAQALAVLGRGDEELAAARAALAAAERAGDPGRAARARVAEARHLVDSGSRAYEVLEDALERARGAGDAATEARAIGLLGHADLRAGRFEAARGHYLRQAELARRIGDSESEAEAGYYAGEALLGMARYREARDQLDDSVAVFRRLGLGRGEARAGADLAFADYLLGDLGRAREGYRASLGRSREIGFVEGEAVALVNLALLAIAEGSLGEADEALDLHLELARALRSPFHEAYDWLYRGELARARGEPEQARLHYEGALGRFRALEAHFGVVEAALGLGRLAYETGRTEAAVEILTEARRLVDEHALRDPGPLPALYLALLGDGDAAAIELPASLQPVYRAEGHLLLHRAGVEGDHLAEAERLLDGLSAHLEGAKRTAFWHNNPLARAVAAAGGRGPEPLEPTVELLPR